MVLGKLSVPGIVLMDKILVTAYNLAVGADGVVWTFLLSSIVSLFLLPVFGRGLIETVILSQRAV